MTDTSYTWHEIGTVSHGTLRTQDLLSEFGNVLFNCTVDHLASMEHPTMRLQHASLAGRALAMAEALDICDDPDIEDMANAILNEEVIDALSTYAPPFCYFGSTEGDGSDFGFWPDVDGATQDEDVRCVDDMADVPDDYTGFVLLITDHGNATLYGVIDGSMDHVGSETYWSIV